MSTLKVSLGKLLICLFCCHLSLAAAAEPNTSAATAPANIVLPPVHPDAQKHLHYFYDLLDLALSKTIDTHGPYQITISNNHHTSERLMAELKAAREINVIWTTPSAAREQKLLPIRISLLRGLNSYRVFLIRLEDIERFKTISTLAELRQLRAGQASQWPDTKIMQSNNLPVVTSAHYDPLFLMLAAKRFDYFPRGLYEIWEEQKKHAAKGIVVEKNLILHYPSPIYYFVNRNNPQLAKRIELGLKIALEDGSFDELLAQIPGFKESMDIINNRERRLFRLQNPDIPNPGIEDF